MSLDEAALNIGRQVVKHAVTAWLDVHRERAQRGRELVDLLAVAVVDRFRRRDLARQFEQIGDGRPAGCSRCTRSSSASCRRTSGRSRWTPWSTR